MITHDGFLSLLDELDFGATSPRNSFEAGSAMRLHCRRFCLGHVAPFSAGQMAGCACFNDALY